MNVHPWIAGSLLALLAIQPARGEAPRPPQESQNEAPAQQLRRAVAEESLQRREPEQTPKFERLSPEERVRLRRDINAAGRNIYRRSGPTRN